MMTLQDAQNMVLTGFAFMNREQRTAMRKFLKLSQPKLDFNYPNGAHPTGEPTESCTVSPAPSEEKQ